MPPFPPDLDPTEVLALEEERLVIGALLLHGQPALAAATQVRVPPVCGTIETRHFATLEHRRIFHEITMILRGASPVRLHNVALVDELKAAAAEITAVPQHTAAIIDAWFRRQLLEIAVSLATNATARNGLTGKEALALAERRLADLRLPAVAS
jgi:hypothetical protein